jgi:uncharacterized SAM-binding protein YcdF (DUF218 family)
MAVRRVFRKRFRRRWLAGAVILIAAVGAGVVAVLVVIIVRYGVADRARPADVIVVLGGGESGTTRRAVHAAALFRQGYAPYLLCSGNIVSGEPFSEAERCAMVACEHGVPAGAIVLDEISRSTEENAIESAAIMQARGWEDAVLVSDDFHLWRATWLFEHQGVRVWPSPAQVTTGDLPVAEMVYGVLREVAATGWYAGKSLLGLPYTRVGD